MTNRNRKTTTRKGSSTVEFALCLPVFMSVLFGTLEFARATQLQQTARLAAFEGARAGISLNAASTDVTTAVNTVMSAVSISHFTTTVTPASLAYTTPTITVSVSLSPVQNAWITWFISSSTNITATVTLSREVQAVSVP